MSEAGTDVEGTGVSGRSSGRGTALVYGDVYLRHLTGPMHPESPDRLRAIVEALKERSLWSRLVLLQPRRAEMEWVEQVHRSRYVRAVQELCQAGGGALDADTPLSPDSFEVALYAVGGVLEAVDAVLSGKVANAFCAVRPPGHHACPDRGMGFCIFNNVAIAARYLQGRHGIHRVLIVDWDVHHGNGTQEAFYDDGSVFYFSVHQFPHYPGTGTRTETGYGEGEGTTCNVPLPAGADDRVYERIFLDELRPKAMDFEPEFVLVSAGFDLQQGDLLGSMRVSEAGIRRLTEIVCEIATASPAQGRLVSVLEGGYALDPLRRNVCAHVDALLQWATRGQGPR
ncbi:MAG: histone deacetylase [candidate division KSB1 bacterium]|nr:histone deacetylase [candidate division KSB1 bacterium]